MNPIDFRGQRSKVKVTMEIYGNKLVKARGCYALRCYIYNNCAIQLSNLSQAKELVLNSQW